MSQSTTNGKATLSPAERGRSGGRATVARHGVEHMRAIGKRGFAGLARRLGFVGSGRRGALSFLASRGKIKLRMTPGLASMEECQDWAEDLTNEIWGQMLGEMKARELIAEGMPLF